MQRSNVASQWTVHALDGPVPPDLRDRRFPATVPGCVTTDLLAAGAIPDPYLDDNEQALAWIGRTAWAYDTELEIAALEAGERLELVFEGLDTVAAVVVNDVEVGRTCNMHRSYRFDIGGVVQPGRNRLQVRFVAPIPFAEEMSARLGPRPHVNEHPFNAVRKMAANFGWDWGPDVATSGIWRPVRLERWRTARLATVRPVVEVTSDGQGGELGVVTVHADVAASGATGSAPGRVRVRVGSASVVAEVGPGGEVVARLEVGAVERWWPAGHGPQALHDLEVELLDGPQGQVLDSWRRRIGFRTVRLDCAPDDVGTPLRLVVNDRLIRVRGANWIPDDCFVSRVGRDRCAARLAEARGANVNLIRVWGGGIYESDDFYDVADEMGLLVWQDFLFACAAYAEEEPLRSEVVAEASEAVVRLAPHPSLAVWSGCNENLWGHEDWGWKAELGDRTWGAGYYHELLPGIVDALDGTRPYVPGTPTSLRADLHPNDPAHGAIHVWDVWNERDYSHYRSYRPRFVAEFGFQGPPTWSTLTRAVHDDPLRPDGPAMLVHQKAADGMAKLAAGLAAHLPAPRSMGDWHWATSLNQARAVATAVEWWRSLDPRCDGIILWQLNDCWPVISWSAIDGDGRRKPLWYALRRSYADRLLTIQPRDGGLSLLAVNDGAEAWEVAVAVRRMAFDGTVRASHPVRAAVAPGTVVAVALPPELSIADDPADELLVAGDDPRARAMWFFCEDVDGALPPPELEIAVERTGDGYALVLTASSVQRDVAVLADKASPDAIADDMLLTLLPGESTTVRVRTSSELDIERLAGPDVVRSANQLVHPRAR